MRRRLSLLVAATTTLVLIAFLIPLAVLVGRVASSNAIADATARSQLVVSSVASGATPAEVASVERLVERGGYDVTVREVSSAPRATVSRLPRGRALIRQPVISEGRTVVVATVVPREHLREGVGRARVVLLGLGVVLVALSLLVADRLARAMTRPISEQAVVAHRLAAGDLSARVRPDGPDEVRHVGEALNLLAARISELLTRERESVADLSHRLRTPITALRLGIESLPGGPDRESLSGSVDELTRQVDALIREARRSEREGVEARCDARKVVAERTDFWRPLAEDQERAFTVELAAAPVMVRCAEADLEALLDALLGNVFAHTAEGSEVSVRLRGLPDAAELVVSDRGPGFPDETVMERGQSRAGSTGLGLDIVRRTARASGGDVSLRSVVGGGAEVTVSLGRAHAPD